MNKKELKKLWTRVAKGEISEREAQDLIKPEKTQPESPVQEFEGKSKKDHTHKRKQVLKEKKESK